MQKIELMPNSLYRVAAGRVIRRLIKENRELRAHQRPTLLNVTIQRKQPYDPRR